MNDIEYGCADASDRAYMEALDKLLQKKPNDYDTLLKKGILSCEPFRRYEESEAILDSLIEKNPCNVDAYFWQGECLFGYSGNCEKAEKVLRAALEIDPNRADCHKVLASTLDSMHRDTYEIEFHYRRAIELEPSWPAPRKFLASVLFDRGDFEQAQHELELAIICLPKTVERLDDPIVKFYETLITGRGVFGIEKDIIKFLNKIKVKIAEKNKNT